MPQIDRRFVINAIAFSGAAALAPRIISAAAAEGAGAAEGRPPKAHFGFDDVVRRASDLAAAPYDGTLPKLPEALNKLDFDAYRDIRFKPEKSPITSGPYRLQLFHPGFIYKRPVVVNTIRDGISTPIPFSISLFDYGHTKFEKFPGQCRLRRLPPALPAEFAQWTGRAGVLPRRHLFPLSRPGPGLWAFRAGTCRQHRRRRRGIPLFS